MYRLLMDNFLPEPSDLKRQLAYPYEKLFARELTELIHHTTSTGEDTTWRRYPIGRLVRVNESIRRTLELQNEQLRGYAAISANPKQLKIDHEERLRHLYRLRLRIITEGEML